MSDVSFEGTVVEEVGVSEESGVYALDKYADSVKASEIPEFFSEVGSGIFEPGTSPKGYANPRRFYLKDERKSRTCKFCLSHQLQNDEFTTVEGYFTVGLYEDGTPGELFIEMGKQGSEMNGFANCWGIAISMLLQYGVHPEKLYSKFKYREFTPNGVTGLRSVPLAKSIPDLVVRWMEANLPPTMQVAATPEDAEWSALVEEVDAQR